MEAAAKTILKDAARVVVWDDDDNVLYSDFQRAFECKYHTPTQANPSELKAITHVFGERDAAIKSGMVLGGTRFEVGFATFELKIFTSSLLCHEARKPTLSDACGIAYRFIAIILQLCTAAPWAPIRKPAKALLSSGCNLALAESPVMR
eukprot:365939-Chlamydomonas_euryale.AAC.5